MERQPFPDTAEQAILVAAAASAAGLGEGPFDLLRVGTNNVYTNHEDLLVARVAPAHETVDTGNDRLRNIESLIAAGAPLLSPLSPAVELADGRVVTLWPMGGTGEGISLHNMAALVAEWHSVAPPLSLEMWTPGHQDGRRQRMIAAGMEADVPAVALDFLLTEMHESRAALVELWDELPHTHPVVSVHGDLYPGNVVFRDGRYLLIDCDFMCCGPPEADLAQMVSHYQRTTDDDPEDFIAAYGLPVDAEFLRRATRLRELDHGLWLASMWNVRLESRDELMLRIGRWDDLSIRWTTL
ncbi:MAG: aminoglycoside phosphotransferase family protein [Acidimicrobiaceae bacterium]|nr:aminoglycoside phosphotransferase family protein [Acidimicrobiia bacterium]MCY4493746.1 aminoglycoside phosphotransferase family protein [Acidimicrobiaceae bacterium]